MTDGPRIANISYGGSGTGFDDGRANGRICRAKGHKYARDVYDIEKNEYVHEEYDDGRCVICHQLPETLH